MSNIKQTSVFDFSRARVRRDGSAMSKFDIAICLDHELHYKSLPWTVMSDAFTYSEMRNFLIDALDYEDK